MNGSAHVLFAATFVFLASTPNAHAQCTGPNPRLISVTGTAEINLPPDEVTLTLGIDAHDKELAIAKSKHDTRAKKVISLAASAGVDAKDISTSMLSMRPDYSEEKVPRLLGYEVSQTIVITLKDLSKYESLMTKLLNAGVNRVNGVSFRFGDPRKVREEARTKALHAAKEKAVAMAAELGQNVGKPLEIDEDPDYGALDGRANAISPFIGGLPEASSPTVAPGEVAVRASVHVRFELE